MNNYLPKNIDLSTKEANISGTSLLALAEKHGTPLYVYDWEHILDNLSHFQESFGEDTLFRYAAKAFICKAFVKELQEQGWGTDVVSGGEMSTVRESIGTLETSLFNGTFKSREEMVYFIQNKGGHISIDNRTEVEEVDRVSSELGIKQDVLIRLNLDLGAETHPIVLTSGQKQQFAISPTHAEEVVENIYSLKNINFKGKHDNREILIQISENVEIKIAPGMVSDLYVSADTIQQKTSSQKEITKNKSGIFSSLLGKKEK